MDNAQSAQNNWRKMKQQPKQRQQQQQRTNTNKQYRNDEISLLNYFDWIICSVIMIRDRWLAFYFPFVCCSCTRNVNSDSITLEI